jgi:hypothetical protein
MVRYLIPDSKNLGVFQTMLIPVQGTKAEDGLMQDRFLQGLCFLALVELAPPVPVLAVPVLNTLVLKVVTRTCIVGVLIHPTKLDFENWRLFVTLFEFALYLLGEKESPQLHPRIVGMHPHPLVAHYYYSLVVSAAAAVAVVVVTVASLRLRKGQ